MELMLLILATTYAFSGKYQKDTAVAAYKAGKEPPGLVKARMRHEAGGGKFVNRPGKSPKPKGPGATRMLIASRWAIACEKAKTRGEDKMRRWRAWYLEQAPKRDEQWREKQRRKMLRRAERVDTWQSRWSAARNVAANTKDTLFGRTSGDNGNEPAAQSDVEPAAATDPPAEDTASQNNQPQSDATSSDQDTSTDTSGSSTNTRDTGSTPTTTGTGGIVNYEQAANALRANAERVEQYRTDLSDMADGLGGKHWGEEVHGTLRDMDTRLASIAATYRDKAGEMQQQGDAVRDAEDAHPYVPGQEVVNA